MMIISKYAFADILNESTIVLDPSRIAAQVVSGVGFSIGAGMYEVGVFGGMLDIFTDEKITILDYSVTLEQGEKENTYTIIYKLQSDVRIENNELTKLIYQIPSIMAIELQ